MRPNEFPKLYKRGNIWWCAWRGSRMSTGATDFDQARCIVDATVTRRARLGDVSDAIRLVYDALELRGRTEATKKNARQKLGHFARIWKGLPLKSISWSTITKYARDRIELDGVSRHTVSHELGYLRQAWNLAHAEGLVDRAWKEVWPARFDRDYKPRTRWLTPDELARVLRELEPRPHRAAWVAWIVATGSDVGDVPRVQVEDLDWSRMLVRVRGTKTVFRDRQVPITGITEPLLRLVEHCASPPFVPWKWINRDLSKIAVRLGIDHFTPKDLRRTHGQWLRHAGVPPHLIGRVLGHADSAMADRVYAQGDDDAMGRLVRDHVATAVKRLPPSILPGGAA